MQGSYRRYTIGGHCEAPVRIASEKIHRENPETILTKSPCLTPELDRKAERPVETVNSALCDFKCRMTPEHHVRLDLHAIKKHISMSMSSLGCHTNTAASYVPAYSLRTT